MTTLHDTPGNREAFPTPEEEFRRFMSVYAATGGPLVAELRLLNYDPSGGRYNCPHSGYFDVAAGVDRLWAAIAPIVTKHYSKARPSGIYITANPVNPDLLARINHRIDKLSTGGGTTDADVTERRWMFIDVDPVRPDGIMATDGERQHASGCRGTFGSSSPNSAGRHRWSSTRATEYTSGSGSTCRPRTKKRSTAVSKPSPPGSAVSK